EVACTGFHGANRLASNSLLESLYQGKKLAQWINSRCIKYQIPKMSESMQSIEEKEIILPDTKVLKDMMMKRVGIVRSKELLEEQKNWLLQLHLHDVRKLDNYRIQSISNYFMYIIASLITEAALRRTESRGGHFRSDFPFEDDENW
ncbi:L-aspartate oxidase, partial [Oceanobacillus sp. CF4.6]